jgi:hypothetical protein
MRWESGISDFQRLWKAGCAFHQSVISTGKVFTRSRFRFRFLGLLGPYTTKPYTFKASLRL